MTRVVVHAVDAADPYARTWAFWIDKTPGTYYGNGIWSNPPAYTTAQLSGATVTWYPVVNPGQTICFLVAQTGGAAYGTYSGTITVDGVAHDFSGVDINHSIQITIPSNGGVNVPTVTKIQVRNITSGVVTAVTNGQTVTAKHLENMWIEIWFTPADPSIQYQFQCVGRQTGNQGGKPLTSTDASGYGAHYYQQWSENVSINLWLLRAGSTVWSKVPAFNIDLTTPPPNIVAQIQTIEVLDSAGVKSYGEPYPANQAIGIPQNTRVQVQLTFENFGDDAYFSFFCQTQSDEPGKPPGDVIRTPWNLVRTGQIFTHIHWLNFGTFGAQVRCWLKGSASSSGSGSVDAASEVVFHVSTATAANITVKISPAAAGSVQVADAREGNTLGIVTSDQQFTFLSSDLIEFEAFPNTGYTFTGWSGLSASMDNPVTIRNMTGTNFVQANFSKPVPPGEEGMLKLYYAKFPWYNKEALRAEAQAGGSILGVINPILEPLGWTFVKADLYSDIIGDYAGLTFRATGTDPITIAAIALVIAGLVTIALVLGAYFVRCIWIPLTTGQTVEQIEARQTYMQTLLDMLNSGKISQAQFDAMVKQYNDLTSSKGIDPKLLLIAGVAALFLIGGKESKSKGGK